MRWIIGVLLSAVAVCCAGVGQSAWAEPADVAYRPPVPGEVVDTFDAPTHPWSSGHRGVDLAAAPGTEVGAAAEGTVTFAGEVAGATWVSIAHPDGVTTTYGPLADLAVARGDRVIGGTIVGTVEAGHHPLAAALHWGARRAERYLDPLSLLGEWRPALVGGPDERPTDEPRLPSYQPWKGRRGGVLGALGIVEPSPVATHRGWPLPPNPNHVIGVAGFGSYTGRLPIDLAHLGYTATDITYLSYAGRDPSGASGDDQRPYGPADTYLGVEAAADRLDAQLRAHAARHPGQAVDLVGHSMGGIVVLHWLLTRNDPADPGLPPIGHVVTIASPIEGADLVDAALAALDPLHRAVIDPVLDRLGGPRTDDRAVTDLAPGSPLLQELAEAWDAARDDRYAGPLGLGTRVLTIGASRDVIVPEHRSELPGEAHVVLPGGHDAVRRTEASRQVLRAFLAGDPVPGAAGGAGHWASYLVSAGERAVGEAIGVVTSPLRGAW